MPPSTFRTLSFLGFTLSFGALWGFATLGYTLKLADGTEDSGMLFVWVVSGFVGSLLMVAKNQMLQDRGLRMRIYLSDLAVLAVALVLIAVLPSTIGLLKGLALLLVFGGYYYWYQKFLSARLGR